jgi:hypothetical protein
LKALAACLVLASATVALAQSASLTLTPPPKPVAVQIPASAAAKTSAAAATPAPPSGPATLMLRGLDKITGRPTIIVAPIGKPVTFATLTITARYCYSTPPSETPETAAFVQIDDHRPDQSQKRVFSGWMYASSPGLNGMEHPLYDVWVINCSNGASAPGVTASAAPVAVAPPDSSDKDETDALPEDAGK